MGRNIMSTIDTGTQELLASKENGVGILTMNRPEARNAMSGAVSYTNLTLPTTPYV